MVDATDLKSVGTSHAGSIPAERTITINLRNGGNEMRNCWENDKCVKCKLPRTEKGHDPCLANLPGVKFACCGHGVENGYIYFENGIVIRFHELYEVVHNVNTYVERQIFYAPNYAPKR